MILYGCALQRRRCAREQGRRGGCCWFLFLFLLVFSGWVRSHARVGKRCLFEIFCGLRVVDYIHFFLMLCPLESSFLDAFLAPVPMNDHQWALKPPQKLHPKPPETKGGCGQPRISNYQPFPRTVSCWGSQCNLDASASVAGGVREFWFSSICLPNLILACWCLCYAWKSYNVLSRFILFGVSAGVIFSWNCSCPKGLLFAVCFKNLENGSLRAIFWSSLNASW